MLPLVDPEIRIRVSLEAEFSSIRIIEGLEKRMQLLQQPLLDFCI
jgi:hypothetical protein